MAKILDEVLVRMSEEAVAQVRGIVTDISNYGTTYQEEAYAGTMRRELEQRAAREEQRLLRPRALVEQRGHVHCTTETPAALLRAHSVAQRYARAGISGQDV